MRTHFIGLCLVLGLALWVGGCDAPSSTPSGKTDSENHSAETVPSQQSAAAGRQETSVPPSGASGSGGALKPTETVGAEQPAPAIHRRAEDDDAQMRKESAKLGETVTTLNDLIDSAVQTQRKLLAADLQPKPNGAVTPESHNADVPGEQGR